MANEVQEISMVAPETEGSVESFGLAVSALSIHGCAEPSYLGNLAKTFDVNVLSRELEIEDEDEDVDEDEDEEMMEDQTETLGYANVMTRKGFVALNGMNFVKAVECYGRALEIRVAHFGVLDQACFSAYFLYGFALLQTALQDCVCLDSSEDDNVENDESSDAEDAATGLTEEENAEMEVDTEDTPNNDDDETDLDLALKILDIARVIIEAQPNISMKNIHVLCALGEANFYRDDIQSCLDDFAKAAHIFERLDQPDYMLGATLYLRMGGMCVELNEGANICYENALSCCASKLLSLKLELCRLVSTSLSVPRQSENSSLIRKIQKQIDAVNVYILMVKYKMEMLNKTSSNLGGTIDTFSAKVRHVDENVSSSCANTGLKIRSLGRVGGSMKRVSVCTKLEAT